MVRNVNVREYRKPEHGCEDVFIDRWSPHAMSGEPISEGELMTLFEAAKWAPSAFNAQPWRFVYAMRGAPSWDALFDLMVEFNQGWAKNAAALVVVVSRKAFEHNDKPNGTHMFDTGAAWQNLALQGSLRGLVVHGMAGFDYARARETLHVPDEYEVAAMVAIGKPGRKEDLPPGLQEREFPSARKSVREIAFEGRMP